MKPNNHSISSSDPISHFVNLKISQLLKVAKIVYESDILERNRLKAFLENSDCLSKNEFLYGLRLAYQISVNYKANNKMLSTFIENKQFIVEMMENKEIELLHSLPETVEIHKVLTENDWKKGNFDLSWYLSEFAAQCPPSSKKIKGKIAERKLFRIIVPKNIFTVLLINSRQVEALIAPSILTSGNFRPVSHPI